MAGAMRGAAPVLAAALVVLAAGACVGGEAEATLKGLLPDDTLWYVAVRDVPELLTTLDELGLLEPLAGALAERSEGLGEARPIREVWEKFIVPLDRVFAGELVVAGRGPLFIDGRQSLVFVADVSGNEAALARYLATVVYPYLDEEFGVGPELAEAGPAGPGDGLKLTLVRLNENEPSQVIAFAVDRGVLVVADDAGVVTALLAARDRPGKGGLLADAAYKDVARVLGQPDVEVFIRDLTPGTPDGTAGDGEDSEAPSPTAAPASPLSPLMKLIGLDRARALGAGITLGPEGVMGVVRLTTAGRPTGILGLFAPARAPRARGVSKVLRYVPKNSDMVVAANVGDFADLYKEIVQLVGPFLGEKGGGLLKAIEEHRTRGNGRGDDAPDEAARDIDIERDVLPALGGEVAIAIKVPGLFGFAMAALVEVKDREAMKRLLDGAFARASQRKDSPLAIEKTPFQDVEIVSLGRFPVPDIPFMKITPAYAFVDDFLVFGTQPDVVKVIVNVARGKDNVTSNPEFQAMMDTLPGEPALTAYVDLIGLSRFSGAAANLKAVTGRERLGIGLTCGGDESGVTVGWWCRAELLKVLPVLTQGVMGGFGGL